MTKPLLEVQDLTVSYKTRTGSRPDVAPVVKGIGFSIDQGETVGLVGESGSGKSTTARALMNLIPIDSGEILWNGTPLDLRKLNRRKMQMVFQDPYSSLNPSMPVNRIIGEPLEVHDSMRGSERDDRVRELLGLVGLSPDYLRRYSYEFSGGQRQRIAIARALALEPELVICDEPVSALDVSTQNQIINLLKRLRDEVGLAYLFIAHDLAVVRNVSHRILVMYLGKVVEANTADRLFSAPAHPYTEALISAVPVPRPSARKHRHDLVRGELPDPTAHIKGCVFASRCRYVMEVCREVVPELSPLNDGGSVACHLQNEGPVLAGQPLGDLHEQPAITTTGANAHPTTAHKHFGSGRGDLV